MFLDFHQILKVGRCPNVCVHCTLLQGLLMGFLKGAQRWHEYKGGFILVHALHALTKVILTLPHFKPLIPHPPSPTPCVPLFIFSNHGFWSCFSHVKKDFHIAFPTRQRVETSASLNQYSCTFFMLVIISFHRFFFFSH